MILPIVTYPHDILRVHTTNMDAQAIALSTTQHLIDAMIETMYAAQGIGIAAPQVGKDLRLCIIGKEADKSLREDLVLVNPTWEEKGAKQDTDTEGCLSIPRTYGKVKRYKQITVSSLDRHGNVQNFVAKGFLARVIQHEVDHLDGILFIDTASDIHEVEVQ